MVTNNSINVATSALGTMLQGQGVGSEPAFSTSTYPATNNAGDIIYGSAGSAYSNLAIPSYPGSWIYYANNTVPVWFNPLQDIFLWDHFFGTGNTPLQLAMHSSTTNAGSWGADQAVSSSTHPGVFGLATGTNTNGTVSVDWGTGNGWQLGGGSVIINHVINISALSTAVDIYALRIGFAGAGLTSDPVNGVYWQYTNDGTGSGQNNANWYIKTRKASSETATATSTSVSASTWMRLTIFIDAAASNAHFYVNGTEVSGSPISTNIPTANIFYTFGLVKLGGSTGTTNQHIYFDYTSFWQHLTAAISS